MLEVRNIHKDYGVRKISVLRDISFRVADGKTAALLGVAGSGKSTLMGILTGTAASTAGKVLYNDCEIERLSPEARARIGYMPMKMRLYPEMTMTEYLDHVLGMRRIRKKDRPGYIARALEEVRLQDCAEKLIRTATIYEQTRLKLAQAICGETEFLLLDEPTAVLKASENAEMRAIMGGILHSGRYTSVLSTQMLREAKDLADHILIINNGRIAVNTPAGDAAKGQSILKLRLGTDREGAKDYITAMKRCAEVDILPELEKNRLELMLKYPKECDLRETAWEKSAEFRVPILEMQRQDISLEEIYLQITSDNY